MRSIEHGTLIDDETAKFVAKTGNYIVPTMAIIFGLIKMGRELGFPEVSQRKAEIAYEKALLSGMDAMRRAGVKLGFGTDLIGKLYVQQCREFTIRREVFSPLEILREATSISAELMMMQGRLVGIAHAAQCRADSDRRAIAALFRPQLA